MAKLLALGDCNTLGVAHFVRQTYVERVAAAIGLTPVNCGCTMATTREALRYFADEFDAETAVVTIQYGLVDSWRTFRYAPYVLYYPDNPLREVARKLVKKYKSIARRSGWNARFGEVPVVPAPEYRANLERIIAAARPARVYLIETPPHTYPERNPFIQQYNQLLAAIAGAHPHVRCVPIYEALAPRLSEYCFDVTHLNEAGHDLIATRLLAAHRAGGSGS